MSSLTHSFLFAALLVCAAADAQAQQIHKEVDAEGRVTFTDQPPATPAASAAPATRAATTRRRGGKVDADEAARRLKQARIERELGAQPRSGELKPGTVEVNYRYWQRQEKLRINVERALRRSNETLRPQLALR